MRMLLALLAVTFVAAGCTSSRLEGTWVLDSRDLPDGSVQRAPAVTGCCTWANGYRNFNVYWEDDSGNPVSISSIALYELTDTAYRETNLYYRQNGLGGGPEYDFERTTSTSPIATIDGRLELVLPLHNEPRLVVEGDRLRAIREGVFVDHWRRVD